jgi:hypothetical protein
LSQAHPWPRLSNVYITNQKLPRLLLFPLFVVNKSEMTTFTVICDERMTRGLHVGGLDHKEVDVSRNDNLRCELTSDKTKPPYIVIIKDYEHATLKFLVLRNS